MIILTLSDTTFEQEVEKSEGIVVVDFWAPWCGPCNFVSPVIEQLAQHYKDKIKVGKLNVDDNRELSLKYGVRSIPTVMFFKRGQVEEVLVGARTLDEYKGVIIELMEN
jgi:thioredoxin 1